MTRQHKPSEPRRHEPVEPQPIDADTDTEVFKGSWKNRRRVVFLTLMFCATSVAYLIGWGEDTRLGETLAQSLCALAGATIGGYVFGSAWEHHSIRRNGRPNRGHTRHPGADF